MENYCRLFTTANCPIGCNEDEKMNKDITDDLDFRASPDNNNCAIKNRGKLIDYFCITKFTMYVILLTILKRSYLFYCRWIKDSLPNQWFYVFLYSVSGENISYPYSDMTKVVSKLRQNYSFFLWHRKCDPN